MFLSLCYLIPNPGDDVADLHTHLAESVRLTSVGSVVDTFSETLSNTFSQRYLHDFVRMVHKSKHKKRDMEELEYEVHIVCMCHFVTIPCHFYSCSSLLILLMLWFIQILILPAVNLYSIMSLLCILPIT